MGTIVKPHAHSDGAVARPDHVNENVDILYNEINGNLDWENLKAALQNAPNGLVKLNGNADVPLEQIPESVKSQMPSGGIIMWSGTLATVPSGWSLCDGTGETPDLRDKFIYGWTDGVDPGGSGGAATHTHTYSDLPSHTHGVGTLATSNTGAHTHSYLKPFDEENNMVWGDSLNRRIAIAGNTGSAGNHTHTVSGSVASAGVAAPETDAGSTLPPYFKLAFIMKD